MYRYILFDLDRTLTESAPGIINSIRYTYRRYGLEIPNKRELESYVGPPLIESFMKYAGFSEDKAREAVNVYREYFADRGLFENAVYPGIPKCLQKLAERDYILAVATSKPEVFCRRILEHFKLTKYFRVIKGIPLDGENMTKAEVIARAVGELGISEKRDAVMVGDRDYDVIGARENGIDCVGVLYGYGSRAELEQAGAVAVCESVEALERFFE